MTAIRGWPSSLRFQLTFWYAALLALPLIIFAVVCYVVFSRALLTRTDRFMGDALSAFSRELLAERKAASTLDQAMETTIAEVHFPDLRIAIVDSARNVVASSARTEAEDIADRPLTASMETRISAALRAAPTPAGAASTLGEGRGSYRVLTVPLSVRGRRFTLAAAYPLRDIEDVLAGIRRLFSIAIPLL